MKQGLFNSFFSLVLGIFMLIFCSTSVKAESTPVATNYDFTSYDAVIQKIHYNDQLDSIFKNGKLITLPESKAIGSTAPKLKIYIIGDPSEQYTKLFFTKDFPELFNKYQDSMQFLFRFGNFTYGGPTTPEGQVLKVAMIAECAALQNQFWANLNPIMANSSSPSLLNYLVNIDSAKMQNCLAIPPQGYSNEAQVLITQSRSTYTYLGINSTPAFIFQRADNPYGLSIELGGAQDISYFERAIQDELGNTAEQQQIQQLEAQNASQSAQLALNKQKVSFLQTQIEILQTFIKNILHFFHLG